MSGPVFASGDADRVAVLAAALAAGILAGVPILPAAADEHHGPPPGTGSR